MKANTVICAAIIATAIFAGARTTEAQPASPKLTPFEQELINVEKQFFAALQAKNVAYAERAVATDFQGVASNGDTFERGELVGEASGGLSPEVRFYDFHVVRLSDTSAVVTYSFINPGDHPRYLQMSDTWAKEGGEWKLKFQQQTPRLFSALDLS